MWGMCPGLLRQPLSARRPLPAVPVQQQHRHVRHRLLWQANRRVQEMPLQHWGPQLWHLQEWIFWRCFPTQLQKWVARSLKKSSQKHVYYVHFNYNYVLFFFFFFYFLSIRVHMQLPWYWSQPVYGAWGLCVPAYHRAVPVSTQCHWPDMWPLRPRPLEPGRWEGLWILRLWSQQLSHLLM